MADTQIPSGLTNSPFVGVKNCHVAKLLTDEKGKTATYDTSVSIPWLRQVQIKPKNNQEKLYADNQAVAVATATSSYDLTVEMGNIPLEYKALLLGHKYENGKITVSSADAAPYFALMFESTKQNGKSRFVRFTKVQFTEPDETSKTKEENVSFNTPTMTATAIYRTSDDVSLEQADEDATGYTEDTGKNWYTLTAAAPSSVPGA